MIMSSVKEFCDSKQQQDIGFSILVWNCAGLKNKYVKFWEYFKL